MITAAPVRTLTDPARANDAMGTEYIADPTIPSAPGSSSSTPIRPISMAIDVQQPARARAKRAGRWLADLGEFKAAWRQEFVHGAWRLSSVTDRSQGVLNCGRRGKEEEVGPRMPARTRLASRSASALGDPPCRDRLGDGGVPAAERGLARLGEDSRGARGLEHDGSNGAAVRPATRLEFACGERNPARTASAGWPAVQGGAQEPLVAVAAQGDCSRRELFFPAREVVGLRSPGVALSATTWRQPVAAYPCRLIRRAVVRIMR